MLKRYYIINFATHQQSTHIPMYLPIVYHLRLFGAN